MRVRPLITVLLALAAVLVVTPQASAGARMETSIMDDQLLLNASPEPARQGTWRCFGAWVSTGCVCRRSGTRSPPRPTHAPSPPGSTARTPSSPRYNFAPLDRVIAAAAATSCGSWCPISTPAPVWASADPARGNQLWKPRAGEFADFAEAVTRRYAGHGGSLGHLERAEPGRVAPAPERPHGAGGPPPVPRPGPGGLPPGQGERPRRPPRWSASWPRAAASGRGATRGRSDHCCSCARWPAATPAGARFERGRCKGFRPSRSTRWATTPTNLLQRPTNALAQPGTTRRSGTAGASPGTWTGWSASAPWHRAAGAASASSTPSSATRPRRPTRSPGSASNLQRLYLQQAAYIAQRTPRVRGLNQFRLTDGAIAGKGLRRFEEFQSGLMFRNRSPKPAFSIFAHPFVIAGERFWGQVRPGGSHTVRVQRRPRARGSWRLVAQVPTDRLGYFTFRLRGRKPGYYRYLYEGGQRSGTVRVRR